MPANYKDEVVFCPFIGAEVIMRCSLYGKGRKQKGIIVCRGPENTRRYWKKCQHSSIKECPVLVLQRGIDKEITQKKKEPTLQELAMAVRQGLIKLMTRF